MFSKLECVQSPSQNLRPVTYLEVIDKSVVGKYIYAVGYVLHLLWFQDGKNGTLIKVVKQISRFVKTRFSVKLVESSAKGAPKLYALG